MRALRAVRFLVDVVTRPPAAKLFALHRQLADQLGQRRVVWVTPGGEPQVRYGVPGALLPIEVELARALVQEHMSGHVALLGRKGSAVDQQLGGDPIPPEDVRPPSDYIDLYWLHVWDVFTPVEEVVRALDDLVRAGKVLYAGISDTPAWIVSQAVALADLRGWTRFAGLQVPYSLLWRDVERDLLPMAHALDLAVTTWEPLGGGLLTGRYGSDRDRPRDTRIARTQYSARVTERNLAIADAVNELAAERDASAAQVAIAWLRAQQQRAVVIPIVGARTSTQIRDSLGAVDIELSAEELDRLDQLSRIELGFPHDFAGRVMAHGSTFELVDDHRRHVYTELGPAPLATVDAEESD